jgi:hypothetical protein
MMILWTNDPLIKRNMWVGCLCRESYGGKAPGRGRDCPLGCPFGRGGREVAAPSAGGSRSLLNPRVLGEVTTSATTFSFSWPRQLRCYGPAVVAVTRGVGILANWGALGLLSRNLR